MCSQYDKFIDGVGEKLAGWIILPKIDSFIARQTKLQHRNSRRIVFAAAWIVISVIIVVLTWYLHALMNGGVNKALDEYDTRLPRISYTGANAPAYYFFCTLIPIGCLIIRGPVVKCMVKFQATLVELGMPLTGRCHCFWCCCCCCCLDSPRSEPDIIPLVEEGPIYQQPSSKLVWKSVGPHCTCVPYLPYMILALAPLVDIAVHGMVVLTVVSISFSSLARVIHLLGATCFFYGMIALEGCWIFSLFQISKIWPYEFVHRFGFDLSSHRFKVHKLAWGIKLLILIFFDYLMWIITFLIGYYTGEWGSLKFQFRYITALSQWSMVFMVVVSVVTFAYDVDIFITKQKASIVPTTTEPPDLPPVLREVSPSTAIQPVDNYVEMQSSA